MKSEWPLRNISEVADFLNFRRVPLKSLDRDKRPGTYPYYGASGIVDFIDDYIFDGEFLLISEDGENLRTRNTPIAFKASGKFWVNNHAHILAEKEEGILDYLTYYFSNLDLTPYITGAVQPKLNKANLDSIDIPVPPKNERLSIVGILNSLSRRIEVNRQTNQTLEQIAQAIFKCWFVDFEPTRAKIATRERWLALHEVVETSSPTCYSAEFDNANHPTQTLEEAMTQAAMVAISGKTPEELEQLSSEQQQNLRNIAALFPDTLVDSELGEIPEGWVVVYIESQIERISVGKKFSQKTAMISGKVPILDQGKSGIIGYHDESPGVKASTIDPVLVFANHTCNLRMVMHDFSAIQNVLPFKGRDSDIYWLYFSTKGKQQFEEYKGHWPDFIRHKIVKPSDELDKEFGDKVASIFSSIHSRDCQIDVLQDIRDSLLPKLLSGQLRMQGSENLDTEATA